MFRYDDQWNDQLHIVADQIREEDKREKRGAYQNQE